MPFLRSPTLSGIRDGGINTVRFVGVSVAIVAVLCLLAVVGTKLLMNCKHREKDLICCVLTERGNTTGGTLDRGAGQQRHPTASKSGAYDYIEMGRIQQHAPSSYVNTDTSHMHVYDRLMPSEQDACYRNIDVCAPPNDGHGSAASTQTAKDNEGLIISHTGGLSGPGESSGRYTSPSTFEHGVYQSRQHDSSKTNDGELRSSPAAGYMSAAVVQGNTYEGLSKPMNQNCSYDKSLLEQGHGVTAYSTPRPAQPREYQALANDMGKEENYQPLADQSQATEYLTTAAHGERNFYQGLIKPSEGDNQPELAKIEKDDDVLTYTAPTAAEHGSYQSLQKYENFQTEDDQLPSSSTPEYTTTAAVERSPYQSLTKPTQGESHSKVTETERDQDDLTYTAPHPATPSSYQSLHHDSIQEEKEQPSSMPTTDFLTVVAAQTATYQNLMKPTAEDDQSELNTSCGMTGQGNIYYNTPQATKANAYEALHHGTSEEDQEQPSYDEPESSNEQAS